MAISHIGANVLILAAVFYGLAIISVALRLYSQHLKRKSLGLDDYAAIVALIFVLGEWAALIIAVLDGGMGWHLTELEDPTRKLTILNKCLIPLQLFWAISNTFVKISICFLYISIFRIRRFRIAAYFCIGLSVCYMIAVILETLLVCQPLEFNWNFTIEGHCGNRTTSLEAVGILNLITDFFIFLLPMPVLWGLQLPVGKKIGLTATFGIGIVICAISIIRIVSLAVWDFSDFTYGMGNVAYWSLLEPGLGVICCCIPVLQPVISKVTGSALWSSKNATAPSYGNTRDDKTLKTKDLESGGRFQRMNDGSYPLTHMSDDDSPDSTEPALPYRKESKDGLQGDSKAENGI